MISADYKSISGDIQLNEAGYTWHYNTKAESAIGQNKGNCGATSNRVNYILKDDYEEIGYINFSADTGQGGHVFNYIKQGGKYFIIDFLQYPLSNYKRYNYTVDVLDSIEEYPRHCIVAYGNNGKAYQIKIIVSYQADSQIPIANKRSEGDEIMRFFPVGTPINVLYEFDSEKKGVEFIKAPSKLPS